MDGGRTQSTLSTGLPSGNILPSNPKKRQATTSIDAPPAKKSCGCHIVTNTVNNMMHEWFLEENKIYLEDNTTLSQQLEEATRLLLAERRRSQLLRTQLEASRRYSRMVAQWVPQVEEMFQGDFQTVVEIQDQQTQQLEEELRLEDPGEETEPETDSEE